MTFSREFGQGTDVITRQMALCRPLFSSRRRPVPLARLRLTQLRLCACPLVCSEPRHLLPSLS